MKQRRLAAIMFTDLVGYTALMGKDENRAFQLLRKNREIQRPIIEKYGGEWLKEMGDGILASFNSSSDAVRCAGEIQAICKKENIKLRIGIHEGEVVFEEGDVLGDGVNIASRLQEDTGPGHISISGAVYNNVRNKPDIKAEFVKETTFKNVDQPIKVYEIIFEKSLVREKSTKDFVNSLDQSRSDNATQVVDGDPSNKGKVKSPEVSTEQSSPSDPTRIKRKTKGMLIVIAGFVVVIVAYLTVLKKDKFEAIKDTDGKISIAVMPFKNLSGDTLYNWWQVGIQNILITELSNSRELNVRQNHTMYLALESKKEVAKASITPALASEIASQLETKTFILGSILKAGNKIRITAQLVNTETEDIFKTYEMDGNMEDDIFNMTDSLATSIKNYLEIKKLTENYKSPDIMRSSIFTNSSEAFKYYIFGHEAFSQVNLAAAADWYIKAIEVDPDFINAYIGLIFTYGVLENDDLGKRYLNIANEKKHELPVKEQLRLDHLNAYYYGTPDDEIKYISQILEMDEMDPTYWFLYGRAHQKLKQYRDAINCWEKMLKIYGSWGIKDPNWWIYYWLGDAYHQINDHKREEEVYEMGLSLYPGHPVIPRFQAICALSQGNFNKAHEYLSESYKKAIENAIPEQVIISELAKIFEKAAIPDSAELNFRKALALDPGNPTKMNELAYFLINHDRNLDEGIKLNEKALELNPADWHFLDTKGWGLYKQGKYEEAIKVLKDAWPLKPSSYLDDGYLHIQTVEKALSNRRSMM